MRRPSTAKRGARSPAVVARNKRAQDPVYLARRALREARAAVRIGDELRMRVAAGLGWLAANTAADLATGSPFPRADSADRVVAFARLEHAAGLHGAPLLSGFDIARRVIHDGYVVRGIGESSCSADMLVTWLGSVLELAHETCAALARVKRRRDRRRARPRTT